MRVEDGLQPNHSEYMRLIATLDDEKHAGRVHGEFVRYLDALFARGQKFPCASFGRSFDARKEFREWKKREWNPIADKICTLSVEKRDGRIHVSGSYGLILDDWSREELSVALDGTLVVLRVYTVGYGLDHLEQWLQERGAKVNIYVEGEEHEYRCLDDALREAKARERHRSPAAKVKAPAGKERPGGLRTAKRHDRAV